MYRATTSAEQARPAQSAAGLRRHHDGLAASRRRREPERSVPPEVLKPRRAQARGVSDRDVAEPVLDRAGVNAVIGELVAEECRSMWNWNGMRGR